MNVSNLRVPYSSSPFLEQNLVSLTDPMKQFNDWFETAFKSPNENEPNAACLSTCTLSGYPSSRMLLVKKFDDNGFTFYSNYNSRKGLELKENCNGCLLFFWSSLHRQVRVEGEVSMIPIEESDAYFNSRPNGNRISATVSPQSEEILSREDLKTSYDKLESAVSNNDSILSRPTNWGGYLLKPSRYEFWQGQTNRLHDRIIFTKQSDDTWITKRLAP